MRILLVDQDAALARAWRSAFDELEDVEVVAGDYFGRPAGAMVSPANSFGIMDGPLLVVAPTMRVPEGVGSTLNAYLAFRAVLLACKRHDAPITSLVCCGLATGIGRMDPIRCATQMRMAYRHAMGPARIPSFREIHAVHDGLRTA